MHDYVTEKFFFKFKKNIYIWWFFSFAFHNVSPDQLFAGLSRIQVQQGGSIGKIHFRFDRNSADALKK